MSNLLVIFRRETSAYFNSAIAYIFIIVFMLLNSVLYMTQFFVYAVADMRPFFSTLPLLLAVFLPAVTMRLWADERKGNTLELLLTFPMSPHALVLGKFLASLVFYLAALAGTLVIPLMLKILGRPDMGALTGAYFGAILIGGFFLAIGIFISGLARDQIVAFIVSMMVCFGFYLMGTEFVASSVDGWVPGFGTWLRNYIGTARHFDSFAKGVIDNRDIIYFLLGTSIFLTLNGFWIEGRMRPRQKAIFTTVVFICLGIFLMGNWVLAGIPLGRFDLSQGRIYTIGQATKKILKNLKAPVTAKLYISPVEKMPTGMKMLEQDIRDKLDEYRVTSGGKFQYKVFHMEAANVVEDAAEKKNNSLESQISEKGIRPFQVQSIEADEMGVRLIYSSMALGYKEKPEQVIPRIATDNIHELEYLLISKIYRMNLETTPKIAVVAPYEEKAMDPQMQMIMTQLGRGQMPSQYRDDRYEFLPAALDYEGYQQSRIRLTEKEPIPEGTKTLAVIEPTNLDDRQRYEINRFLRGGGSVLIAAQNYEFQYVPSRRSIEAQPTEKKPEINPLISKWGFELDNDILMDQQSEVISLGGAARMGPFAVAIPVKTPMQILIPPTQMNPDVSITSRLSSLFYLWGSALKIDEAKIKAQNLKSEVLFTSSRQSWLTAFHPGLMSATAMRPILATKQGPFPLAVIAQGQFLDAFEGQAAPAWPKDPEAPAQDQSVEAPTPAPITPAAGKLILVGASSIFTKELIRGGGHLNFFLNCIDAITLGDELVTIRSKQPTDRSIGRVSSGAKVLWRTFVMFLVPVILAIIGTFKMWMRRQSKQNYIKLLASVE